MTTATPSDPTAASAARFGATPASAAPSSASPTAAPSAPAPPPSLDVAPGSVVRVRDEDWLVTQVSANSDGTLVTVQGLSELVQDVTAQFSAGIDRIEPVDPRRTHVVADTSTRHRLSRLWLEATLRKTALPAGSTELAVVGDMLADPLPYQLTAVRQALDPANLRPRILLADTVGLGKTLEIGMILAELVRRGRGDRILIVTPRHVLEQMQHEMWSRFALPFVRLDSVGIQRVRRTIPATRNPFSVYHRAIISIDTLKSDRYLNHLRKQRWDAVVIDESHNVTNKGTLNNRLADILARQTDALILASATPHNGDPKSFAELIRLLEPTAVRADGSLDQEAVRRLVIRRHRHSEEVRDVVGDRWKERLTPVNRLVAPSPAEDAVASELSRTWLHRPDGASAPGATDPGTAGNGGNALFSWTLAKAFLSSPAALIQTIDERMARRRSRAAGEEALESSEQSQALSSLRKLAEAANTTASGKYQALLKELHRIGVGPRSTARAVVFAERVATLNWLAENLRRDLRLRDGAVRVMHGGLSDVEQQEIVEEFRQAHTPLRVLVTGDVASEGVNLHAQCHELIHYDIPWSLIRIEQRNGRIDRYGQETSPQITTLLLDPSDAHFSGDVRVLTRLMEKEDQAHRALGDAASLMGLYSGEKEEKAIREALQQGTDIEQVVPDADAALDLDPMAALFASLTGTDQARSGATDDLPAPADAVPPVLPAPDAAAPPASSPAALSADAATASPIVPAAGPSPSARAATPLPTSTLYDSQVDYLRQALTELYERPEEAEHGQTGGGGVSWREHEDHVVELVPPAGLRARLAVLPQSYLQDRHVQEHLLLATSQRKGKALLAQALRDSSDSSWPEAHYLGPLHPVLDWAGDRVLARLGRSSVFAVHGEVESPTVLLLGTLTNLAGRTISLVSVSAAFPFLDLGAARAQLQAGRALEAVPIGQVHGSPAAMFAAAGVERELTNAGGAPDTALLEALIAPAVDAAEKQMALTVQAAREQARTRVESWAQRADSWDDDAGRLIQNRQLRSQRQTVAAEHALMEQQLPAHTLVRPLLVVVPQGFDKEGDR
ncbi:SNF2 family N-terminal domain-containing protein [Actinomyces ruminicola]|uniref:SNF2 family N-terminal domain-containing protein n=1 Tax=Actinomyces ruminicola TaxID=332524 RepID=A0A1H0CKA9_9ACTO|nr:helicase-related protein [Actinomyces ruminicola]SDN58310.1 SNF2 family N-terminal domain-containing protein [Actinomyces ruminicola]